MTMAPTNSILTEAANAAATTQAAVDAHALCKTLDDRRILDGLTFEIPRGRFVALLGANGAGKTTLLRILATLVQPTSGRLSLLGTTLIRSAATQRSRIGLIGHAPMLYRDLTLLENLVFFGRLYGLRDPSARARELLEYVGLSSRTRDPIKTFSRGMVQRAAIARALMNDPELLLADEPFSGLDAPSRDALEQTLRRLHAEGRTIVLANHDLAQSLELAEHALVLQRGRLALNAASSQLNRSTILAEVSRSS